MKALHVAMAFALSANAFAALPANAGNLECRMHFDLSSWSLIYKHASGEGKVTCADGSTMNVKIRANGGGLTVGKSTVKDGVANFTDLESIADVPGTYVAADATAGVPKSGTVQVMTKSNASMALSGAGKGFGLGVSIGGMTLEKVP